MRRTAVQIPGKPLWLTKDLEGIRRQLAGQSLGGNVAFDELLGSVSTDELIPAWACYYYDETLGRFCLVGLRGGVIEPDSVARGGYSVVVSGPSAGCGSSRETAPAAQRAAGIQVVAAESFEKIYRQNCENIGLVTTTNPSVLQHLLRGEAVTIGEFTRGLDPISRDVVELGGLFAYNRARLAGHVAPPALTTTPRRLTLCEKIIARHAVSDARTGTIGAAAVAPGDSLFVRADVRFSHDYVTAMARALFVQGFGSTARVSEPDRVFAFRDHLTFLDLVMPARHLRLGLRERAAELAFVQEGFVREHGIQFFGEVVRDGRTVGSEAICHQKILESIALPGQVIIGTDSHTCMAGAMGCLAFGVGSTDMANAWLTRDVRLAVPPTVRVDLTGSLRRWVTAKDAVLDLLGRPFFKNGGALGKVLEFTGSGVTSLSIDERATLTNMAVEGGAFTGILQADDRVVDYLVCERGMDEASATRGIVRPDDGADYAETLSVDLGSVEPMVSLPGDPKNAVKLADLASLVGGPVRITIAYGGSCTGGKKADMDMYAEVLARALSVGRRVSEGVRFFIQFGSQEVRAHAVRKGYLELFHRAGALILDPSCGACINAGPGVSTSPEDVTVSAINRNYVGRSGPGKVFLASPRVVAASAVIGQIAGPDSLFL